jgi:membrane protein YdbS with pleckstrin-like domain
MGQEKTHVGAAETVKAREMRRAVVLVVSLIVTCGRYFEVVECGWSMALFAFVWLLWNGLQVTASHPRWDWDLYLELPSSRHRVEGVGSLSVGHGGM